MPDKNCEAKKVKGDEEGESKMSTGGRKEMRDMNKKSNIGAK